MKLALVGLGWVCLSMALGCGAAGETASPEPGDDTTSDELRTTDLGADVVAVRVSKTRRGVATETVTVAKASKVKTLLAAIKPVDERRPVCGSIEGIDLKLLDASGKVKVDISSACGLGAATKGTTELRVSLDLAKIAEVREEPLTLSDRFWGPDAVTKIEMQRTVPPHTDKAALTGKAEITEMLDNATLLTVRVEPPACRYTQPHYGLTLLHGTKELGKVGASCGAGALETHSADGAYTVEQVAVKSTVLTRLFNANER